MEQRRGSQKPTQSVVLEYKKTKGKEAVDIYNKTGRTAQEWQAEQVCHIMAVNEDGWSCRESDLESFTASIEKREGRKLLFFWRVASRDLYGAFMGQKNEKNRTKNERYMKKKP